MKYCTKCGNQLFDDAVVCLKCGCLVQDSASYSKKTKERKHKYVKDVKEHSKEVKVVKEGANQKIICHISNFIANILYSAYFCFAVLLFSSSLIKVYGSYAYISFDSSITMPLFIVAILNVILTLFSLIFYLCNCKNKTIENIFKYISRFIAAALLVIPAILIASAAW